ncbi:hypothetical protein ACQKM2_12440 [Streptomyces sp. NPDC004126]|uniref:hypothetical protein n=1 Tax=Streptomyces sp. NPDC004126 TaxID=3390695 RepID=UPI003D04AA05
MRESWFYPDELANDLQGCGLSVGQRAETLAQAWEYNRSIVPQFSNWNRYIALARLCGVAVVAEVFGELVDVMSDGPVLGYDIDELLGILFGGSALHDDMAREYRASLLMSTEKSSGRRDTELMRRYVDALAHSPRDWFRLRDCDGMFRFYIAAAIACDNSDDWLSDEENSLIAEISDVLYDAVAFHKHRAEGEIHSTFAYADPELRTNAFRAYREVLWAIDTAWSRRASGRCAVNFARCVGGPIHQMMRRYRFVEDGLTIGRPETEDVISNARQNSKLWYRIDAADTPPADKERYEAVLRKGDRLLFPGMAQLLQRPESEKCPDCLRRPSYGAESAGRFGGVLLCPASQAQWAEHLASISARAAAVLGTPLPR